MIYSIDFIGYGQISPGDPVDARWNLMSEEDACKYQLSTRASIRIAGDGHGT
jgi:hypothetical protein